MTFTGIGAAAAALVSCEGPARVAGVPVHFTSHQLCSATFVGGLDPTEFYNEAIKPKLGPVGAILRYEIDRERQEVRAHLAGLLHSRAVYDGPFGCRVLHLGREARFAQSKADEPRVVSRSSIAGLGIVAPANDRLSEALDHAFAESDSGPRRFTKAVVVLHRGRVVGERYAPGVTPATPLIGWSMTKSVTNALLGILVRNGKLDMKEPAAIAEWSTPSDPRHGITADQLLRMVSGIGCGQSLKTGFTTLFDADTQMEFDMADQSAFAANARLRAKPGAEWRYTNCNFILLSRMIRDAAGGDATSSRKFIERELFAPLGFEHATLEYDSAGVPLGTDSSLGQRPRLGTLRLAVSAGRRGGERPAPPARRLGRLLGDAHPAKRRRIRLRRGLLDPARRLRRRPRTHCRRLPGRQLHGHRQPGPIHDRHPLPRPRDRQTRLGLHAA